MRWKNGDEEPWIAKGYEKCSDPRAHGNEAPGQPGCFSEEWDWGGGEGLFSCEMILSRSSREIMHTAR